MTAKYTISDHDPIISNDLDMVACGENPSDLTVSYSSLGTKWHDFKVYAKHPYVSIYDVQYYQINEFFPAIPGGDTGGACVYAASSSVNTKKATAQGYCDVCKKNNKKIGYIAITGELEGEAKIHLVNWTNSQAAKSDIKQDWNRFMDALEKHEKNHEKITFNYVNDSKEWADSIRGKAYKIEVCCGSNQTKANEKLLELIDQTVELLHITIDYHYGDTYMATLEQLQEEYDQATNHGVTEGVKYADQLKYHYIYLRPDDYEDE